MQPILQTIISMMGGVPDVRGYAYFLGGHTSTYTTLADKYNLATQAVSSGAALDVARCYNWGIGNATVGISMGGSMAAVVSTTSKYNYATQATSAGGSMNLVRYGAAGFGNATKGYYAGGNSGGGDYSSTGNYTYSSDTSSPLGATLATNRRHCSGIGSSTVGFCVAGFKAGLGARTDLTEFTYSSETITTETSTTAFYEGIGVSGPTYGLVGGGDIGINSKEITYSTRATAAGTNLSFSRYDSFGAGDSTHAVITGGQNGTDQSSTCEYNFSSKAVISGTAIGTARDAGSSHSSSPTWL